MATQQWHTCVHVHTVLHCTDGIKRPEVTPKVSTESIVYVRKTATVIVVFPKVFSSTSMIEAQRDRLITTN